jgi:hypothetical protein
MCVGLFGDQWCHLLVQSKLSLPSKIYHSEALKSLPSLIDVNIGFEEELL